MKKAQTQQRQGMALVLVIVALAIVSTLGFAILSSASLQASEAESTVQSAQADELAESGVMVAMYYLQHPSNAPSLTNGVWTGGTNMTIGSSVSGTASVTVSVSGNQYTVHSIGSRTGATMGSQSRSLTALISVSRTFAVSQAVASNSNLTIPAGYTVSSLVSGVPAIATTGTLTVQPLAVVTGTLSAASVNNQSLPATTQPAPTSSLVPTAAQVNHYSTYTYNGATYSATTIAATTLNSTTLGPTASNPAGVYLASTNLNITGGVTVNGTLVVQNGTLLVSGILNTVTPKSGCPALVVDNSLEMSGVASTMTANGTVWLGQGMTANTHATTLAAVFTVNGALLMNTGGFVMPGSGAVLYTALVNYNAATSPAAALTSSIGTPQQVQVVSWTPG
jgi:type II secretory pathway pseudopilin PulG